MESKLTRQETLDAFLYRIFLWEVWNLSLLLDEPPEVVIERLAVMLRALEIFDSVGNEPSEALEVLEEPSFQLIPVVD